MNNSSKEATPNIKRVISVGWMGNSQNNFNNTNIQETNTKKPASDLHKLNDKIRSVSLADALNRANEKGKFLQELLNQTSELDSLKNKDFQTHKINPLFQSDENLNQNLASDDESLNNIIKIDVNSSNLPIENSNLNKKNLSNFSKLSNNYEEIHDNKNNDNVNKIMIDSNNSSFNSANNNYNNLKIINNFNNQKNNSFQRSLKNNISVTNINSNLTDKINLEDTLSLTFSNDEPIYMDPMEVLPPGFNISNDKSFNEFTPKFSIHNSELDSYSQKNFFKSNSTSDSSSIHDSPSILSFKTNSTAFRLQYRKKSEILSEVKRLKNEMSQLFMFVDIKSTDLLYNLVLVNLYQKFWIGNLSSPTIGNYLHFGDQILNVNGEVPNDIESLMLNLKSSKNPNLNLKLRRLPYARIITISDIHSEISDDQFQLNIDDEKAIEILKDKFGIKLKQNTAKIEKINENGLFYKNGLKYDPNRVEFDLRLENKINTLRKYDEKQRLTKWVITEINGDFINYRCNAEEILARIKLNDTTSIIVQPYDLVKALFNQKRI